MSGKKRLRNIANGLCGAFASRNNDLGGDWAIGKLRSLAGQCNRTTVVIDLLTSSMQPSSCEFTPVLARYQRLVAELANVSHVPLGDLTVACITLDFMPAPWPRASYCKPHWGDQFTLTVTIDADGRAAAIERHAGYCRPHDPAPAAPMAEAADARILSQFLDAHRR